ncbi:lmo0937 family membrane protein [Methylopila henanensis]|uniref:Lmo0937 family membrane protein n=1 Tax=Methylopila henanensis TaxID=873516 RepID=A0ABW4KCT0_9HYPH
MPWALIAILVIVWALSFIVFKVSGALIHLLLLAAAAILIYRLVTGRRAV